jgi:protein-S-isoprenylcysteine O-methyltransferase Ste14
MWALDRWWPGGTLVASAYARAGLVPAALGIVIDLAAIRQFRQAGTTVNPLRPQSASRLVTGGIFRRSRNPMYVGLTCILVGYAVALGSASPWLVPAAFVATITWLQILPEERALATLFGAEYAAYRRDVRRWL